MAVKVQIQHARVLVMEFINKLFNCCDFREDLGVRVFVSSVQIEPTETAPVVAINNTVHIDHGHNQENKVLSQYERII